jgi:peptidoglycan/xylan/chitin deacetylase (PgdA/CDA1 family)
MPMSTSSLRPDRLITVGLVHPAVRVTRLLRTHRVPILMYHGIRNGLGNKAAYFETNTSPETFAAHVRYLHDRGYTPITLSQALAYNKGQFECERPVVITFDDGFKDFYTHAMPVLSQYSFSATMFVVSDFAGTNQAGFLGNECMSWTEVREIQSLGIEIGSHTVSHPVLYDLSKRDLALELSTSREAIEEKTGRQVVSFSYPFAFPEQDQPFVNTLRALLQESDYQNGVSTIIGTAGPSDDPFFLPRLPINAYDDLGLLRAKLDGAYNWLHVAQKAYKSLRRGRRRKAMFEEATSGAASR